MDILGQLRKLIALTFKAGNSTITLRGDDALSMASKNLTVEIPDGDPVQTMVTDSSVNEFTNKTIDTGAAGNNITIDTADAGLNFRIDSGDANTFITLDADDPNITITNLDFDNIKDMGVRTEDIQDAAVTTVKIADINVTTAKIADLNVTTAKLDADAVDNSKLADNAVQTENIVDSNVTTVKIADLNVTNAKLEADAVTNDKLADNAVQTENIANLNVTTAKLEADAVDNSKLADNAVQTENIVDGNVTDAKIDTMTATKLTGTIDDARLSTNVNLLDTNQVVTGHKTLEVTNLGTGTAINDNASSTLTEPDKTIIPLTGTPTVTDIETLTDTGVANGRIVLLRNDTVATFVLKSTGNIATTDDIELAPEAVIMLCYDGTDWDVVGGSGAGGAGGLELATLSSGPITADISTHYLVDTTANAITVNLPDGSALTATEQKTATIRFTDSTEQFSTNNLILVPNSGEQIDGFAIDESLIVDVAGAWVEISWDSATNRWALNTSGGSGGGGGGGLIIEEYAFGSLPANLVKDRHYLVDFGGGSSLNASATLPAIGTDVGAIKVTPINNGGGCTITLTADGSDQINDPELGSSASYIIDVGSATFNSNINDNTWEVTDGYWSTATEAGQTKYAIHPLITSLTASDSDNADLRFNNLTIGQQYKITIVAVFLIPSSTGQDFCRIQALNNGVVVGSVTTTIGDTSTINTETGVSKIFTAAATSLIFDCDISGTGTISNTGSRTYAMLEELPQHKLTDKFT